MSSLPSSSMSPMPASCQFALRLEGDGAALGLDGGAAVHGVVHPSAVDVAEEDVVHSVAVEVADGVGEAFDRPM